jgi:hypothetical protein
MKRYFVEHVVDTPMSVGDRHAQQLGPRSIRYNIPNRNASILVFDSLSPDKRYGITTSNGLGVHVHLDADDLSDAVRTAKDITEVLLGTLSFASVGACPPAVWRRAYEASPGLVKRRYRQFFEYRIPGTMQQIDQAVYAAVFRAIDPLPDERIIRAMTWFRRGLGQASVYDRLIHYWSTLETLDGLLEVALPPPKAVTEPRLGKGMLRFFVAALGYTADAYWALKSTRNDVIHGLVPLSRELTEKIGAQMPELHHSCVAALCYVLKIEPETEAAIADLLVARGEPFSGHMEADIELPTVPPLDQIGLQPWMEFPPNKLSLSINSDGTLHAQIDVKIGEVEMHNAKLIDNGIRFTIYGAERRENVQAVRRKADGTTERLDPASGGV